MRPRISVCGDVRGACVYERPVLLVQNNCLQEFMLCVCEQTGTSLSGPMHPRGVRACSCTSVCLQLYRRVTRCAGPRRGLRAVRSLPARPHGAARPNTAHTGPEHWSLPATLRRSDGAGQAGSVRPGPKVGVERPWPPARARSVGWDEYRGPTLRVGVGGAARPERSRGVGRAHTPELKGRWDGHPRTCRESSRNAAWKSCLPGAGRRLRLRLWKPGPAGDGAGALLSSRAAPGRILPGRGAGPRRGPRGTPGPRPRAWRAAVRAARWANWRSARGRGGRARAWKQERPAAPPGATGGARSRAEGPERCVAAARPRPLAPPLAETPPPAGAGVPNAPASAPSPKPRGLPRGTRHRARAHPGLRPLRRADPQTPKPQFLIL